MTKGLGVQLLATPFSAIRLNGVLRRERALNGVFGRCRCNRIGDTDVRIELTGGQLNIGKLERAFEFECRNRVRTAAVRANKRQNAVTVRKAGQLGGLYVGPKCKAGYGVAVRDGRVRTVPHQGFIGFDELDELLSELSGQVAGAEGDDVVGLSGSNGFRNESAENGFGSEVFHRFYLPSVILL